MYLSTQHPSCRENTALPHSIVILLTQMVDKWHRPGQAGYFINLSTVRDRGCLASCLWCQGSVLLLWEDMLTHQLSMLFPLSCVLWSMSSNEDCQWGLVNELHFRTQAWTTRQVLSPAIGNNTCHTHTHHVKIFFIRHPNLSLSLMWYGTVLNWFISLGLGSSSLSFFFSLYNPFRTTYLI